MKEQDFIAHVKVEDDAFRIQTVKEHSVGTADLSESFATVFGAAAWGKQNGWWHDMGKYTRNSFQPYIRSASGMAVEQKVVNKSDHSSAGAILAKVKLPGYYQPLAYCIAGHHSGLLDWTSSGEANLDRRLSKTDCYQEMQEDAPEEMQEAVVSLNAPLIDDFQKEMHQWIRMLFSCLVDADYLDTERFMQPEQANRRGQYDSMETLKDRFDTYMESLTANAPASFINEKRAAILSRCREMGGGLPGFFSLTVPTGGGKTLASLAWALTHAVRYQKDRIIIVIPYTSIIVQTAAVLRNIFGTENVVEHHSNLQQDSNDERSPSLLATENWDAPIIVTTNVQFFESLYACRSSRCRKLHNICNSVVILDEAQMLPVEFLHPVLDGFHAAALLQREENQDGAENDDENADGGDDALQRQSGNISGAQPPDKDAADGADKPRERHRFRCGPSHADHKDERHQNGQNRYHSKQFNGHNDSFTLDRIVKEEKKPSPKVTL